jgi:nucleoside-diphosphate-sugar epimerase
MSDPSSPIRPKPRLFCFGLGFSASELAKRLVRRGWDIAGTSRSEAGAEALRHRDIDAHVFNRDTPLNPTALRGVTHLLLSIPPDDQGDPVIGMHEDAIAALRPDWIGYLSTTGVYGDHGGNWVDEETPLTPTSERGRRRVEAEEAWFAFGKRTGLSVQSFRLAGIYGPRRSAIDTVRSGRAHRIYKPGQFFSRIHVEDLASVLEASIAHPSQGVAYNVCDDEPAPPQDVIDYACHLLGLPSPPLVPIEQAELSPMAASFYSENKRVSNQRIKQDLGVTLAYPDYRTGLKALLS